MRQYHDFLRSILEQGVDSEDRTGTGTRSIFGYQMRFDLSEGFPLVTTKRVHLKSVIEELLWFIRGDTNAHSLRDRGVTIWDEWADPETGELGPVYGRQWRSWPIYTEDQRGGLEFVQGKVDQLASVIAEMRRNPNSRRLIVSAWNVGELDAMALPPCHLLFQFYVRDGKLSCQLYQRSADAFLGVPFNIASYALLTMMVAQVCGLTPGEFIWTGGDCHIYRDHMAQVELQLSREPRALPVMTLNPAIRSIDDFRYEDFSLQGYDPWPGIKGKVSV